MKSTSTRLQLNNIVNILLTGDEEAATSQKKVNSDHFPSDHEFPTVASCSRTNSEQMQARMSQPCNSCSGWNLFKTRVKLTEYGV